MTAEKKEELKNISYQVLNFFQNTEMSFKEYEALSNAFCVLNSIADDGCGLYQFGKNIMKLSDFTYTEEQLNYVVPARWEEDKFPWEKQSLSSDTQRQMMRSQDEANSDKRFMKSFSRPSIDRFMR